MATTIAGSLWRGHLFLFDKAATPATHSYSAGTRLLIYTLLLEALRVAFNATPLPYRSARRSTLRSPCSRLSEALA